MANPWGKELIRSPDVTDENGQVLQPRSLWKVAGGLRARDTGNAIELDAQSPGLDFKESVRVATAAALAANTRNGNVLTANANGALAAVDGVSLAVGNRLLVKNEATLANNGIYVVTSLGSAGTPWVLTRAGDFDESIEVNPGTLWAISEGTANSDKLALLTNNAPITLNVTGLAFRLFTGLAGPVNGTDDGKVVVAGAGDLIYSDELTLKGLLTYGGGSLQASGCVNAAIQGSVQNYTSVQTLVSFDPTVLLSDDGLVTVAFVAHIFNSAGPGYASVERKAFFKIVSGTITQIGSTVKVADMVESMVEGTDYTVDIDTSAGAIRVRVNSVAADTHDVTGTGSWVGSRHAG